MISDRKNVFIKHSMIQEQTKRRLRHVIFLHYLSDKIRDIMSDSY